MKGLHSIRNRCFLSSAKTLPKYISRSCASRAFMDVTGNSVNVSQKHSVELDEAIYLCITRHDDCRKLIAKILSAEPSCTLANALYIFESFYDNSPECSKRIKWSLQQMESRLQSGEMSNREKYLAAASFAQTRGQHALAGKLLETSLLENPNDVLVMRLAQDAYLNAGDAQNAFGCIARNYQLVNDGQLLFGHVMCLLARGYAEIGLYKEAEELGNSAISRTRGNNIFGLEAVLTAYHMTGRSSEVEEMCTKQEDSFTGINRSTLLFYKGLSRVLRSNFNGGLRSVGELLDSHYKIADCSRSVQLHSTYLATLLLWQVCLNSNKKAAHEQWKEDELIQLWCKLLNCDASNESTDNVRNEVCNMMSLPMYQLAASMALSQHSTSELIGMFNNYNSDSDIGAKASKHKNDDDSKSNRKKINSKEENNEVDASNQKESAGMSMLNWLRGMPPVNKNPTSGTALSGAVQPQLPTPITPEQSNAWLQSLLQEQASTSTNSNNLEEFPSLAAVKPSFSLNILDATTPFSNTSDLCTAVSLYSNGDYYAANEILNRNRGGFARLGRVRVEHALIEETLLETFLRTNQFVDARMMLFQHVTRSQNDGQAWRKLCVVFAKMGLMDQANAARYNWWQLGAGTGGFGGFQ